MPAFASGTLSPPASHPRLSPLPPHPWGERREISPRLIITSISVFFGELAEIDVY